MGHVTDEWVMARIIESCHTGMSHVVRDMSYVTWRFAWMSVFHDSFTCLQWRIHVWHGSCHTWMRHYTHVNESPHTYEWTMSHLQISHEPCYTYKWVTWHVHEARHVHMSTVCYKWMDIEGADISSHVTLVNTSCHTHEWVLPHTNTSESSREWVTPHTWMNHVTITNESCHVWMCHVPLRMTHLNVLWGGYDLIGLFCRIWSLW